MPGGGEDRGLVVDQTQPVVLITDRIESAGRAVSVARERRVERDRVVGLRRLQAVEHLLLAALEELRDLGNRRRAAGPRADHLLRVGDPSRPLLGAAVDMHCPAGVAEVALQLADDRGDRERCEREAAIRIEALDRLDQPQARDLYEVVVRLTRRYVATRKLAG